MTDYKTQIVNMVLDHLVATLKEGMQTAIPTTVLSYADVVKKGLLQTDKTSKNVQIGVMGGDHEDPNYLDGIITMREAEAAMGMDLNWPREVGGGQLWWRKGVVRVECFFVRERLTEDEAFDAGYEVLGRAMNLIEKVDLSNLTDDFDEHAIMILCYQNTYFESGGPPKSYIFRGKILWSCLTERP